MFVKSIMIPNYKCITVQKNDTLKTALEKMEVNKIDGLPVLDGEEYIGELSRVLIYQDFFMANQPKEDYLQKTLAGDKVTFIDKYLTGSEVFEKTLLDLKDFPLISVVDEKRRFKGIVTRADVLEQFESVFGTHRPGIRIAFTSPETEGRIARLAEITKDFHEHIISFVTFDETDKFVRRMVMKIEKRDNIDKYVKKLEDYGFRILSIKES